MFGLAKMFRPVTKIFTVSDNLVIRPNTIEIKIVHRKYIELVSKLTTRGPKWNFITALLTNGREKIQVSENFNYLHQIFTQFTQIIYTNYYEFSHQSPFKTTSPSSRHSTSTFALKCIYLPDDDRSWHNCVSVNFIVKPFF